MVLRECCLCAECSAVVVAMSDALESTAAAVMLVSCVARC